MARKQRVDYAGANHHVFARGVDRQRIFHDRDDYEQYIRLLAAATSEFRWRLMAFALMPNHIHLLLETPEANLAIGMQWLQSAYSRYYNARYGRPGHRWATRYGSTPITDDLHFLRAACYVVLNPVSAGLCQRPEEWPWSSQALVAAASPPRWLADELLRDRLRAITGRDDTFDLVVA